MVLPRVDPSRLMPLLVQHLWVFSREHLGVDSRRLASCRACGTSYAKEDLEK
jgi:hypothetical protein